MLEVSCCCTVGFVPLDEPTVSPDPGAQLGQRSYRLRRRSRDSPLQFVRTFGPPRLKGRDRGHHFSKATQDRIVLVEGHGVEGGAPRPDGLLGFPQVARRLKKSLAYTYQLSSTDAAFRPWRRSTSGIHGLQRGPNSARSWTARHPPIPSPCLRRIRGRLAPKSRWRNSNGFLKCTVQLRCIAKSYGVRHIGKR